MSILYAASRIHIPYRGGLGSGGSTHTQQVAMHLARLGHRVVVACGRRPDEAPRADGEGFLIARAYAPETSRRERARASRLWPLLRAPAYLADSARDMRVLGGLVREARVDLVYERACRATVAAALVAKRRGLPYVLEVNDHSMNEACLRIARAIVTPDARAIAPRHREKVVELEWGVDVDAFRPDVDGAPVRAKHGLQDAEVVVFVGSGMAWHGLGDILAAAPDILRARPRARFLVVGGGAAMDAYAAEIARQGLDKAFVLAGAVPYGSVPAYVAAGDVALAPYTSLLAEGDRHIFASPIKVWEYMASGKPTVTTRVANVRGTIEHESTGLVIPEDSPRALADATVRLLADRAFAHDLGEAARRSVVVRGSWASHAKSLSDLFEACRGDRR